MLSKGFYAKSFKSNLMELQTNMAACWIALIFTALNQKNYIIYPYLFNKAKDDDLWERWLFRMVDDPSAHCHLHLVPNFGLPHPQPSTSPSTWSTGSIFWPAKLKQFWRGAADQFKITAVVFGGGDEEKNLKEKEGLRGRMVFPGQLSLLQAVGEPSLREGVHTKKMFLNGHCPLPR